MNIELLDLTYYDFYQVLLTACILILSSTICLLFARTRIDIIYIFFLYIWHTVFSYRYYITTVQGGGDAIVYYRHSIKAATLVPSPGTEFVKYMTTYFTRGLGLNYLNTTLVYSLFGAIGLTLFYLSLKKHLKIMPWYWGLIVFLPSLSYWSSAIGKDAISFLSVCILLYAVTTAKRKNLLCGISILLMLMVRPHVAFMIVGSFVFYFIVQSKAHIILKLIILPFITFGSIILLNYATEYAGVDEASVSGVAEFYDSRQGINNHGGGGIDTSSMSLPLKVFSYMFRPLPFEASSLITFIASIENSILLLSFIYLIYSARSRLKLLIEGKNLWLTTYVVFASIILSYGLSNLGIAARQKWMFMPILIYLLIEAYRYNNSKKMRKYYEVHVNSKPS